MYVESDLLPISALQHLLFCPRQAALIHIERVWVENRLTAEGQLLHHRAHEGKDEWRGTTRFARGLAIRSLSLGLIGKTDVVEFHFQRCASTEATGVLEPGQLSIPGLFKRIRDAPQNWRIVPVEYKRGRPKRDNSDRVQLCAQAICLEEMLKISIAEGSLFYGVNRRRTSVAFDQPLRRTTADAALRMHELMSTGKTPTVDRQAKCNNCSLLHVCLPEASGPSRSASRFLARQFAAHARSEGPETDLWPLQDTP